MATVPDEETDKATRAASLKKIYALLKTKYKRTLRQVLTQLQEGVKKKTINFEETPHEYYVQFQHYLAVRELHGRIRKGVLHFDDIRDTVENLVCLYEYLIEMQSTKPAKILANLINELLSKMDPFAQLLEGLYHAGATNWIKVGGMLDVNLPITDVSAIDFIPDIKWFTSDMLLGVGGFGSVFKASLSGGPVTSVKLIAVDRFKSSENAASGKIVGSLINSPHLVRLFAWFSTVECYVTVMEYIDGVDLHKVVKEMRGLPLVATRVIIAQLCMGLRYLHFKGFIHRDIKPSNVMLISGCRVKLIDFDTNKLCIGKFSMKKKFKSYYRRTGREFCDRHAPGTLSYMPPEVLSGGSYGRAQDWWAVGITLYQLHTNKTPFAAPDKVQTKTKIIDGIYKWPISTENPEDLIKCVEEFLAKNPKDRLASRHYNDIQNHTFFNDVDWASWEEGSLCLDWVELEQIIDAKATMLAEVEKEKGLSLIHI